MKKIIAIFAIAVIMAASTLAIAADNKSAGNPTAPAAKAHGKSIFNTLSDFFSTFDRPFARPGNKQGFYNATADWVRNINK